MFWELGLVVVHVPQVKSQSQKSNQNHQTSSHDEQNRTPGLFCPAYLALNTKMVS